MSDDRHAGQDSIVVAEYRLLNALCLDEGYRSDSRVHPELFVHEVAKSVYEAIEKLSAEKIPITQASLLQSANEIDFNVNAQTIDAIFKIDEGTLCLDDILRVLSTAIQKKQLTDKLNELRNLADTPGPLDSEAMLEGLFEVDRLMKLGGSASLLKDFDQWSDEYIADLEERSLGKRYPYGDDSLDQLIFKGAYPGAITTIAAGTGQGKSTYVLNLINSLIDLYVPCMYVSLEMSGIDTYDRLIALRRDLPMEALYSNDASLLSIVDMVKEEKETLKANKRFFFVEEPSLSIAKLRSLIKEYLQRANTSYAIIAVDLVTQLKDFMSSKGNMTVANSMELAMNALNALAKEMNVHIIAVVQFNRDADNYKLTSVDDLELLRPSLNNIKNSAAIAERSRVVLSLFRKKYYADRYLSNVEGADAIPDIMELTILKNSSGPVGNTKYYAFEGDRFRVTPMLDSDLAATQAGAEVEIEY